MTAPSLSEHADLPRRLIITVHGTPAPQGSKRHVGHGVMIESSKAVKPWREAVKYAALHTITRTGWVATDGPVSVEIWFHLRRPARHYRTGRNAHLLRDGAPIYPAGKPDLDKLARSTLDALGDAGVWRDDARVVELVARKEYAPESDQRAGAYICVLPHFHATVGAVR